MAKEQELTNTIEAWFSLHEGEEDFWTADIMCPYSVATGSSAADVLLVTKTHYVYEAIAMSDSKQEIGLIACFGLPKTLDIPFLQTVIGSQRAWFLGDLDPKDLMIYLWLSANLKGVELGYLGICDLYLEQLNLQSKENLLIPLTTLEDESFSCLKRIYPNLVDLVGQTSMNILDSKKKLEIEAIVSFAENKHKIIEIPHLKTKKQS